MAWDFDNIRLLAKANKRRVSLKSPTADSHPIKIGWKIENLGAIPRLIETEEHPGFDGIHESRKLEK